MPQLYTLFYRIQIGVFFIFCKYTCLFHWAIVVHKFEDLIFILTILIFFSPGICGFVCLRTSIASALQDLSNVILWLMLPFLAFDPTLPQAAWLR